MESTEITQVNQDTAELLEKVLVNGDLSALTAQQRLDYYQRVCQSMKLNPLSRPFDYIVLNGKMTLYAKKDATDQLRNIYSVSIDDVKIEEDSDGYTAIVKGRNAAGRSDVEIGCVTKKDMGGSVQNLKMKAVTKAKRRLTLSLCGLGLLDETELETIQDKQAVIVDSMTGEIIDRPKLEKPRKPFDEDEFLKNFTKPANIPDIDIKAANTYTASDERPYKDMTTKELYGHWMGLAKKIKTQNPAEAELTAMTIGAICRILYEKKLEKQIKEPNGGRPDPFVKQAE